MKTTGEKVALIAAIILIFVYIAMAILGTILCIKFFRDTVIIAKKSITPEKFVSVMKDEGFEVKEITGYADDVESKKAYKAQNGNYTIEFYEFDSELDSSFFYNNREKSANSKSATKKVSMSGKNYELLTLVKNGEYYFIERVDKTVVIVYGNSKHEDASKTVLKKFGY